MRSPTITTVLAAGFLACAAAAHAHGPGHAKPGGAGMVTAHRVVVADAASATVRVIDLDSGATLATYTLTAPARLHAGASGRYVYAAQPEPGRIAVIDTGVAFEDHGDHADLQVSAPRLLRHRLDGPRPSHFNQGAGRVAAFFDGAGLARVISEEDLIAGRVDRAQRLETGIAHHGVAKPIGRFVAISVPTAGARLPDAIELRDDNGRGSERIACPRMHGEATTARFTVFACADGVVVYDAGRDGVTGRRVAYPRTLPPERMIRSMVGAQSYAFVAGDFGPNGMVVLDPAHAEGEFRFIELPARRVAYTLHPASGDRLFVMLEDGRLAAFNPLSGETIGSIALTGRYSLDTPGPRPRLSTAGPYVIVSNPVAGEVVVLDAESLEVRRRIEVPGAPSDILAVGGTGAAH
jgi:hypothetical protein